MVHLSPSIGVLGVQKVCVSEQTVILPWRRLAAEKAVCRMLLSIGIRLKCEKAVIPLGSGTKILDTGNFFFDNKRTFCAHKDCVRNTARGLRGL